ncbi:BrnA antitoxin family protein [soil metagenome]
MLKKEKSTTPNWTDMDDAPRLTREIAARGEIRHGEDVIRAATGTLTRGRPKLDTPKQAVSLRLDKAVLDKLRESGPGWQSRANAILKKAMGA